MDSIGQKIGIIGKDISPWYSVTHNALKKFGALGLMVTYYECSHYDMLRSVYPEHNWIPWKFNRLPSISKKDTSILFMALKHIEAERKMENDEEWYRVSESLVKEMADGFALFSVITQFGGFYDALKLYKPHFPWEEEKFIGIRNFGEKTLGIHLRKIWPDKEVLHVFDLADSGQGAPVTVSFLLPNLRIAFDFQSSRDYCISEGNGKTIIILKETPEKVLEAKKNKISVIFVPFWWDRTLGSLVATILDRCPEVKPTLSEEALRASTSSPIIPTQTSMFASHLR